ncbi:thaumatin-like protein 1 [Corylus avellana]|uniref:thaumatin-like protein 1 n=1 Tax=Corylus avellana TaxID=13451 RepID=UPI001E225FBE|nr:thaumatin-like protein 1 [Corylus avellana]
MRARILFGLTLALLFIYGAHSATITVTNNCPSTIWLGDLTSAQQPQLSNTGFELASTSLNVPTPWNGRFWARTRCSIDGSGKFTCATTDCGSSQVSCNGNGAAPPTSLVEITITPSGRQDFYDINLVNGFNLPVSVAPQGGSGSCTAPSCAANVNAACPTELQVKTSYGSVISCKSARIEFNQPQYCCTGGYSTSTTCPPTNYSIFFKNQCPRAYSYAYDDAIRLFSCSGGPNYSITFLSLQ